MALSNERTWPDLPLKKFSLALVLEQTSEKRMEVRPCRRSLQILSKG